MKKIIVIIALLVTATFAATSITVSDLVKQIMAIPAEQFIAEEVVNKIINEGVDSALNYKDVDFERVYYDARSATYSQKSLEQFSGYEPFNNYLAMRTVVVSKMKEYLHSGDSLLVTYKAYRLDVRAKFKSLPEEAKVRVQAKVASALGTFSSLKNPVYLESFKAFQTAEQTQDKRFPDIRLLGMNLPAEKVAVMVAEGELEKINNVEEMKKAFTSQFGDADLAMFAGRRAAEGGNELLDKYLAVILLMLEDVK